MAGELVGQPAANGQIHTSWTLELDFLGCYVVKFDESSFFSETRDSDVSNGLGLVSVCALLKKL